MRASRAPVATEDEAPGASAEVSPQHAPADRALIALRLWRRQLAAVLAALVTLWLGLVLVGAVGQSSAVDQRKADLRRENERLEAQLRAGQRELAVARSEPFLALQARAYEMGRPGERVFALPTDAPPPAPIQPLGASPPPDRATPLEDWLQLLLGSR